MNFVIILRSLMVLTTLLAANSAAALCIKAAGTNLRKGPGTKFPISWQVNRYTPLLDVGQKGGWYKVRDLDGEIHWVYKSLVSRNVQCLAVRATLASLRKGPGTQHAYAELPSVGKYYSFKKIGFEPPWYRVEDDRGGRYWIHESLVWRPMKRQSIAF